MTGENRSLLSSTDLRSGREKVTRTYCDRVYLLRAGRVEAEGPTADVFTYDNLKRVFETEVYVDTNRLTGKLLVVPLSNRARQELNDD